MNRMEKCVQALETGNLKKAYEYIDKIEKYGSVDEQFVLAEQLTRYGFLEDAAKIYEKLRELYPDEGELAVLLAECYADLEKDEEALLVLEAIPEDDPFYPRSLLIQADIYQSEGLYEVSERKLLEAEKILPEDPVIQFALAELYASMGRLAEAVYKYEQLIEKGEKIKGVNLYHRLANCYSAAGEFEKAMSFYEKALDEELTADILFGFGFAAYQAGNYKTAAQKFSEVKELDPDYESVYLPLAQAYEKEGELEKSLEAAREGIAVNPYHKELYYFAGRTALKIGEKEEAERHLKKALELDPHYLDALLTLTKLLLDQERYEEVVEAAEPVLVDGEEDPEMLWDYAIACQKTERYEDALTSYREAYNDFKENEDFLQNYGFFLMEEGLTEEAIEIFKQLVKLDPSNPDYRDVLERLETN